MCSSEAVSPVRGSLLSSDDLLTLREFVVELTNKVRPLTQKCVIPRHSTSDHTRRPLTQGCVTPYSYYIP